MGVVRLGSRTRLTSMLVCVVLAVVSLSCTKTPATLKLPDPITNNAVAYHAPSDTLYSFTGLGVGKTWQDVSANAYKCDLSKNTCKSIKPFPDGIGRLAATAQTVGNMIYIFGGYTVAKDGAEISTPEVWGYDVKTQSYQRLTDMPVPVDDSVSVSYHDQYIYLISGWHKDDNVVNVQMYDTKTDTWAPASDWPGAAVFGHAGGIVGSVMVVCDGVQVVPAKSAETRRTFEGINVCWRGNIEPIDPTNITWRKLPQLPGKGNYRMASIGWPEKNIVVFAGGSDNPYNYNGIGYDKIPSKASAHVWGYDIDADKYVVFADKDIATMDHRGLVHRGGSTFITAGGMGVKNKAGQTVLADVLTFEIK